MSICKGNNNLTSCMKEAVPNSDYCTYHGGAGQLALNKQQVITSYRLGKFQNRVLDFLTNPDIKSLRGEIGIIRLLIEERFKLIKEDDNGLSMALQSPAISELVSKLERVIRTCQVIEEKSESTLDKQKVINLADQIITIMINRATELNLPEESLSILLNNVTQDLDKVFRGETLSRVIEVKNEPPRVDAESDQGSTTAT